MGKSSSHREKEVPREEDDTPNEPSSTENFEVEAIVYSTLSMPYTVTNDEDISQECHNGLLAELEQATLSHQRNPPRWSNSFGLSKLKSYDKKLLQNANLKTQDASLRLEISSMQSQIASLQAQVSDP